jgi:hypothetical protein
VLQDSCRLRDPQRMVRMREQERGNLRQPGGQRWTRNASITEKAKSRAVKRLDFGPLLAVSPRWRLEGSPHLDEPTGTVRTCRGTFARSELETLSTCETGVSDPIKT